jgi:hypothetical protein
MLRVEGLEWSEGWMVEITLFEMLVLMALEHGNAIVCSSKLEGVGCVTASCLLELNGIGIVNSEHTALCETFWSAVSALIKG